jgi:hypothetical protein
LNKHTNILILVIEPFSAFADPRYATVAVDTPALDRLILFCDRRKRNDKRRVFYDHGIYCREITVERVG